MSDSVPTPPPPAPDSLAATVPDGPVSYAPPTGVTPSRSPLPIVAISLAGLALLLSVAAAGIAWLPAIAGIVLGIIGLVKKLEPRLLSILALVISPVAWLVAIVVAIASLASFGAGLSSGLQDDPPGVEQPADPQAEVEEAEEEPRADGSALDSPLPFGTVVSVDDWAGKFDVSFGAINWDATALIKAENMFNSDPTAGMKYIMLPVTMTNTDDEEWNASGTFFWGDIKLVADGRGFNEGAFVVAPGDLSSQGELYPGGTVTGNVVFEVPVEMTAAVWDVDGVFVASQ
jgi:hypothetical protein